jgi:hypothetical protein
MLVSQWHLDIVYGKQGDALRVMRGWGAEKFASSDALAPFIVPGSQHWVVYRVLE